MDKKLYIGNLPYATTDEDLKNLFSKAGTVASASVIKDRETGRSKGFAFVEMSNADEAQNVINQFNGYMMGGRDLRISIAKPKEGNRRSDSGDTQRKEGFNRRGGAGNYQGGQRDRFHNSQGSGNQQ
jgi:cold-inducible RNA-binding protein